MRPPMQNPTMPSLEQSTVAQPLRKLIVAPIWALAMDIAPNYAGTASGMMNFGFGLASVLSPIFFGYTIEHTQNWTVALSVSAAILLLGALLACYLRPDKPFVEPEPALRRTLS